MASSTMSKQPPLSPITLSSPGGIRSRRDSLNSISVSSHAEKEQLAQALDKIHTSASQSDVLTTFNDFGAPPAADPVAETKGTAGDLVQQGLSGLYSRFKEAVSVVGKAAAQEADDGDSQDAASNKMSVTPISRAESGATSATFNSNLSSDAMMTATTSSGAMTTEATTQMPQSSKASSITTMAASKATTSSGRELPKMSKAAASTIVDPAIASVGVGAFKDPSRGVAARAEEPSTRSTSRKSIAKPSEGQQSANASATSSLYDVVDSKNGAIPERIIVPKRSRREDNLSIDGSSDTALSPVKSPAISGVGLQPPDPRTSGPSSRLSAQEPLKKPAVIDRISRSGTSADMRSTTSSLETGTAEPSPISTSAHNSVHHESFAHDQRPEQLRSGKMRIPGTTTDEGAPEMVNARLEFMRKQVLSKEFWMADETCKECFLCGDPFSAFRRKHHCRTCGCIFDSKCTSTISGQKFGVPGNLRVCKTCLAIINRRYDSGSESGDDTNLSSIFRSNASKRHGLAAKPGPDDVSYSERTDEIDDSRSATTPMMAIPATRRIGDSSNRHSAILEIDAPQLSRPSSSRSLRSLASGRPPSAGHKRYYSKHNFLGRFKASTEARAPFRSAASEEMGRRSRLPAFHDDNIIDPELAPYMSEESSGDEQMSIFATMASSDITPSSLDREKPNFGPLLTGGRRRYRGGEKSISGLSFTSRGFDDGFGAPNIPSHSRPSRRRNLSTASVSQHHLRSPRPKSAIYKGPSVSNEALGLFDSATSLEAATPTRSNSAKDERAPGVKLSSSSLNHVKKLYRQLLQDANIPNPPAWEKALMPILVKCSDEVDPETRNGDHMDIRHYVKLKKVPGGKPGDTSYVSGVIFTKNLALKSMPRSIANPRIIIVSFPIEYQKQQQQQRFMSLQPVIEQEKEYLRVVVNRIIHLRPQVLLAERNVAGVALQYLSEANIAVAYNVKPSVIEAVSRCAKADIVSSVDMLALPSVVGQCGRFEVKTFVNNDFPGRKKTYIFISGCDRSLGCTIALRGTSTATLSRMKKITEFMVYVVYNLKLESCLLRDEYIKVPGDASDVSVPTNPRQGSDEGVLSANGSAAETETATVSTTPESEEKETQPKENDGASGDTGGDPTVAREPLLASEATRELASTHESSHDSQVPEDVPAPTFYSDMVAKYETKILSASPFVKFTQPYLLMKAREQERRLLHLKRLRDQDIIEELGENENSKPQRFQLIKPEMVHEIGQKAPRRIMEVLHAVHDAEYDKALHAYQTQTRHWENYIQGNLDLFDPYSHQNIVVLYSVTCTDTKIPCAEPGLIAISFYDHQPDPGGNMDPDCTLGQYVEDLCMGADETCNANGCDRPMWQHHRTYVHDEARITVFVERDSPLPVELGLARHDQREDDIFMWSYCKACKKDVGMMAMSDSTWKYSFGKYLELTFWGRDLRLHGDDCQHDHQKDHIRYFNFRGNSIRVHYDPIDLLEIVVPRARITWKVDLDLRLKNDIFTKSEERWIRFTSSVRTRIKSIRIDSVLPEKAEACKSEVERLAKKAQEEQPILIRQLQQAYMRSKYYEIIPMNAIIRNMLEKVAEWDTAFAKFEGDFLSDKDVRQLTMIQLKKIFIDNDSKESLTTDGTSVTSITTFGSETDDKSTPPTTQNSIGEVDEKEAPLPTDVDPNILGGPVVESPADQRTQAPHDTEAQPEESEAILERVGPLDLAAPSSPTASGSVLSPERQSGEPSTSSGHHGTGAAVSPRTAPSAAQAPPRLVSAPSLTEKVEQLRKEHRAMSGDMNSATADAENSPELASHVIPERGSSRKSGLKVSPPMIRALSQPVGAAPRAGKQASAKDSRQPEASGGTDLHKAVADGPGKADKKFSDRIGMGVLKNRKTGHSSIPRYVHRTKDGDGEKKKKKGAKVSRIARHFEHLSREFEKERERNREKAAANMPHARAYIPRSSTRATVQVYRDVDQAVQEPGPSDDYHSIGQGTSDPKPMKGKEVAVENEASPTEKSLGGAEKDSATTTVAPSQTEDTAAEAETDDQRHNESAAGSDDDDGSDVDQSLEDMLPDVETIAEHLEPGEVPQEKDKKSNLMKMLSNFWAERSASGWSPLEYPVNATDHIFLDSDVIVREDEPSSLIAFALDCEDYRTKLADIRHKWKMSAHREGSAELDDAKSGVSDTADFEEELEKSLLRATGTHLKYQFVEGSARMMCKVFYAEQFDALRRKCGVADRIMESLSRCVKWDTKGGKTKSVFLKTLDDRLVMKALSPIETAAFLGFAPAYFNIMAEALFHDLPSVIAKMLGFFQVIIKNPVTGTEISLDLLVMENLFYDRVETRKFDLKGSMRNRKIQSTGEQNEVLLDENMVEFIYESPLFAREHSKKLLRASVWNDTLFLARQNVMDYSLMVAVDESRKELVVGVIDCIRTYTWDKKLESWIKDRGFAGGGRNRPTVTSPKEYKSRFREAMARYILQAPNCWHQFGVPQAISPVAPGTRFEGDVVGE